MSDASHHLVILSVTLDKVNYSCAFTQSATCRWTNGVCKSTLHRVVTVGTSERYSTAFFMEPNFNAVSARWWLCEKPA